MLGVSSKMAAAENKVSYELSHQYHTPDFPSKYRNMIVHFRSAEEFIFNNVKKMFEKEHYKGRRIAEVGCGPTVHRLAIPSKYYDEIVTSDYTTENIESVKKWVACDPDALDWTPMFEIAAEIEGYSDIQSGVKEIEARLRQKIKSVVHCDVLKESIFDPMIEKVDLLITGGCLEGVCPTLGSFATAIKNLGHYVNKGGHLLIITALGMSSVEFEGKDIKVLDVDKDFVCDAIKEAGFSIEHQFFKENDLPSINFDGNLLIMAKKLGIM